MEKFAKQIESDMAFLMSGELKKSLHAGDAVSHLSKALDYLQSAGLEVHCSMVQNIIKRASSVDESNIEVQL